MSLEPDAVRVLQDEFGLTTVSVPAGYLRGLDAPVTAIDFAGWLVAVRDDMDDEIAELLARIVLESSRQLRGPVPAHPRALQPAGLSDHAGEAGGHVLPLHPAAERCYAAVLSKT